MHKKALYYLQFFLKDILFISILNNSMDFKFQPNNAQSTPANATAITIPTNLITV